MLPDNSSNSITCEGLSIFSESDPEGFLVLLHLALDAAVTCASEQNGWYPLEGVN